MSKFSTSLRWLYHRPAFWLALLAALTYSSWPLGYVLNPAVGAHDLASQLEALHQPFNWVFIGTDVLTGLLLVAVGVLQWRKSKTPSMRQAIGGYVTFGLLVLLAAVLPLNCQPENNSCGPLIHRPIVIVHGLASIFSVLFLLAGFMIVGVIALLRRTPMLRPLFIAVGACWAVFGIGSVWAMVYPFGGNALQYFFITVCSVSIVLTASAIEYYDRSPQTSNKV